VFNLFGDSGRGISFIVDREALRIFSVLAHEHEEPAFPNPEDLLNIFSFDFFL
jgi:hypothetical protein